MHQLKDSGIDEVLVDPANAPQAAAESAYLSSWSYKEKERKKYPNIAEPSDNVGKLPQLAGMQTVKKIERFAKFQL